MSTTSTQNIDTAAEDARATLALLNEATVRVTALIARFGQARADIEAAETALAAKAGA